MKKKKGYWSSKLNIALFAIMMALVLALFVCGIIVIADVINQLAAGNESYVANYNLSYAITLIFIVTVLYAIGYGVYLVFYFVRRKKISEESNIKIKDNGLEDKETIKLRKTFNAEVIEENAPESGIPLYNVVLEAKQIEEKPYKNFIRFLTVGQTLLLLLLLLAGVGIAFILLVFNSILFYVLIGVFFLIFLFGLINYLFITPNLMYKKNGVNPLPSSVRIYDNRIEEVTVLMSGKEIIYVCKYDISKIKDAGDYLFIKSRDQKAIVGIMLKKEKIGLDKINFVIEKVKNKSKKEK